MRSLRAPGSPNRTRSSNRAVDSISDSLSAIWSCCMFFKAVVHPDFTILFAAAAQPPEPTAVPALSGLGLVLLVVLLAGVAVVLVRRFA